MNFVVEDQGYKSSSKKQTQELVCINMINMDCKKCFDKSYFRLITTLPLSLLSLYKEPRCLFRFGQMVSTIPVQTCSNSQVENL